MEIYETMSRLCSLGGPSGYESQVAQTAVELLWGLMDEVSIDRLGNVIAVKRCGKEGAKRLLLDAHLDEIGLIVTGFEEGFLRFEAIGGVDPRMLPRITRVILQILAAAENLKYMRGAKYMKIPWVMRKKRRLRNL